MPGRLHKVRGIVTRYSTVKGMRHAQYVCAKTEHHSKRDDSTPPVSPALRRYHHASMREQVIKRLNISAWLLCLRCTASACSPRTCMHIPGTCLDTSDIDLARCPIILSLRCQDPGSHTATLLTCSPTVRERLAAEALMALTDLHQLQCMTIHSEPTSYCRPELPCRRH